MASTISRLILFDEGLNTKTMDHLLMRQRNIGIGLSRELVLVIGSLQQAVKKVSQQVRNYGLYKGIQRGKLSTDSFEYKSLQRRCDSIFHKNLVTTPSVCMIGSSCSNELLAVNNRENGKFVVSYVPIEGNLSIDFRLASGSLFSVFRRISKEEVSKVDFLQTGDSLLLSGYALYGVNTILVLASAQGGGLSEFILDPISNEFIKTNAKLKIPESGNFFSINEGRFKVMDSCTVDALIRKKYIAISRGKIYNDIFSGSVVADFHTIIKNGGFFLSPSYDDFPDGIHKLQFIGNPLSFLMTEAGGSSTNGRDPVLQLTVHDPDQSSPLYMGSVRESYEFFKLLDAIRRTVTPYQ